MIHTNSPEPVKIVVVGSASIDLVLDLSEMPTSSRTLTVENQENFVGGKGVNQAVALSRLGVHSYLVGSTGIDPQGQQIRRFLTDEKVNIGFLDETPNAPTGEAYVLSDGRRNQTLVVPGANHEFSEHNLNACLRTLPDANMVLCQLEHRSDVIESLVKYCSDIGVRVGVYASPPRLLSRVILEKADFVIAKFEDLSILFGDSMNADILLREYANRLILRTDGNASLYHNGQEKIYMPYTPRDVWMPMGMGDAFTAGFAFARVHGNDIASSVDFGNRMAAKTGEKRGSHAGLPFLNEVYD